MDNKAFIAGKIYDVTDINTFLNNMDYYDINYTAVVYEQYILPLKNINSLDNNTPGYYLNGMFSYIVLPTNDSDREVYSIKHMADFTSVTNLKEMVMEQDKLQRDHMNFLMSSDNKFKPVIDEINDTPLMIGFKQAVIDKDIDINQYSSRFGQDFNNDRRKFNGNKISLDKFISIGRNLDLKATLIIEDADSNVPNPMGHKIVVDLIPKRSE